MKQTASFVSPKGHDINKIGIPDFVSSLAAAAGSASNVGLFCASLPLLMKLTSQFTSQSGNGDDKLAGTCTCFMLGYLRNVRAV